ncbi:MAG: carbohydrate porin, partial [Nitrospiria bacterium]
AYPSESVDVSIGWFQGEGNYDDIFRQPFFIGQTTLKTRFGGKEGNYRFYGWGRFTPHCKSVSDAAVFSNCDLINEADQVRIKSGNSGFGLSLDQGISESVGIWARFGFQDPDVSQFEKAVSGGVVLSKMLGRSSDKVGLAYGAVFPADDYKAATGRSDVEHYAELYYKYVPFGDGVLTGLHITPDLQLVANPGGDGGVDPVFIWGLRTQVSF